MSEKASQRPATWPRGVVPGLVFVLSVGLTVLTVGGLERSARVRDQLRFASRAHRVEDAIRQRMDTNIALLRATRGLFAATEPVDAATFRRFADALEHQSRHPGIQGIGFAIRVATTDLPGFLAAQRRAHPDCRVWPADPPRQEVYPIVFLEPLDRRNAAAIGYDMATEPVRREAMERARDTGGPAASGLVTLVQEIDPSKQPGFLIYLPVYHSGQPVDTVEQRRTALAGFVYSPYRGRDLLDGIVEAVRYEGIAFEVHVGNAARGGALYASQPRPTDDPRFTTQGHVVVGGRPWTITYASLPEFEETAGRREIALLAVLGVMLSLALFWVTRMQVEARDAAEAAAGTLARAHAAIEVKAAELQHANEELSHYAFIVSHDLKTPLRGIQQHADFLRMDLPQPVPPPVEESLGAIERSVRQANLMVEGLLELCRLGTKPVETRPVGVRHLVEEAVSTLHVPEDAIVELEGEPREWPTVESDPVLLGHVVQNLIANAIKFNLSRPRRAWISSVQAGGTVEIRIRDNGIGIDERHQEQIFRTFERLHRDSEFEGTGLGLSIVRKSLVRLGGSIRVESSPGLGSTFTIVLPRAGAPVART